MRGYRRCDIRRHPLRAGAVVIGVSAAVLSWPAATAQAWFVLPPLVFDAQRFARRVQEVAHQAQEIALLKEQTEAQLRMLAATDLSTQNGLREGLDLVRDSLARLGRRASADPADDLAARYSVDWHGTVADRSRFAQMRQTWVDAERNALVQVRVTQNALAREAPDAAERLDSLVRSSGVAAGAKAALQVRTQLNAQLAAQLAQLQALREALAFARAEREGAAQSARAYTIATATRLARPHTVAPMPSGRGGYVVTSIPTTSKGDRR